MERALKNGIIYLVEMSVGVYVYGFGFLYVGVGRWEKRKSVVGKLFLKKRFSIAWSIKSRLLGMVPLHTFYRLTPACLSQLCFPFWSLYSVGLILPLILYSLYPFLTTWNFLNFLKTRPFSSLDPQCLKE